MSRYKAPPNPSGRMEPAAAGPHSGSTDMNRQGLADQENASVLRPIQPAMAGADADALAEGPQHILLVDDEPDILSAVSTLIKAIRPSSGHGPAIVHTARSGPEAIDLMGRQFFDMVITDYHLGTMDGVTFLEVATHIEPDVPCVLMSGDHDGAAERLPELGSSNVAFLAKPFETGTLAARVRQGLGWETRA